MGKGEQENLSLGPVWSASSPRRGDKILGYPSTEESPEGTLRVERGTARAEPVSILTHPGERPGR